MESAIRVQILERSCLKSKEYSWERRKSIFFQSEVRINIEVKFGKEIGLIEIW